MCGDCKFLVVELKNNSMEYRSTFQNDIVETDLH